MERLIVVEGPEERERWTRAADLPPLDPADLIRHACDAHWRLVGRDGETVARCSLWWRRTPSVPGHRVGIVGHYAARDAAAGRRLLQHACEQLAAQGSTLAVGPMDGNTWRRYRLITERGSEPIFFLEPDNPDGWPAHFTANGFTTLARYISAIDCDLGQPDRSMAEVAARAAARGIQIRSLDPGRFEEELRRIYSIAAASFRHSFLYSPISEADFIAQYRPLQTCIRPELVLIAEQESRPVAFAFAIPDLLQTQPSAEPHRRSGQAIDTVIFKTIAVHPAYATTGLGSLLVVRFREAAHNLGHRRVIHALMEVTNVSRNISRRYDGRTFRRYALFGKTL